MQTFADMSAELLTEAAAFFKKLSETNPAVRAQMKENIATFIQVAELIKKSPLGRVENMTHAEMAARLLREASLFFKSVGEQNPPLKEQMDQNAEIYSTVAAIVEKTPQRLLEENN
jgi:hypothetical protein